MAFTVVIPDKPDTSPRARPAVGPAVARDAQSSGPWQGEAEGVLLEVSNVTHGSDHLAQVRFRSVNTSTALVDGDVDWFSVVDNSGRARGAQADASYLSEHGGQEDDLSVALAAGEVLTGRMQVEIPWDLGTERFDVRANLHYDGRPMRFDVGTPVIAVPVDQRVGG